MNRKVIKWFFISYIFTLPLFSSPEVEKVVRGGIDPIQQGKNAVYKVKNDSILHFKNFEVSIRFNL